MIDLIQREEEILSGLKDFQKATVERVTYLLTHDFTRVLVADEVGLGKTMVARGTIAKLARYHQERLQDDLFKVVYVCSNQNIAKQNLSKLKIDQHVTLEGTSNTRLSMQHLKIFEDEFNPEIKENYIQLIPLTPSTSFSMTGGCGSVTERALIYAVLKRHELFQPYLDELETLMIDSAHVSWNYRYPEYEYKVELCNDQSGGKYLRTMHGKVDYFLNLNHTFFEDFSLVCDRIKGENFQGKRVKGAKSVILQLRKMMAEISVDLIDADLVIMDEFQRFPELINADEESETTMLAREFFNSPKSDNLDVKILLLSATPYKPYSTLEEISVSGSDEHYQEFMQVTNFLFEKHPNHQEQFQEIWRDFSMSLSQMTAEDFAVISAKKQAAEDSLYKGIARTERNMAKGMGQSIEASNNKDTLTITQEDVSSYTEMDAILRKIGLKEEVPVEYVKSAPFLMSFMDKYKLKQKITDYFKMDSSNVSILNHPLLWIQKSEIAKYAELKEPNARMTKLKDTVFTENAEKLLWIPPSLPYYEFGGCYENQKHFSKVLVFSAWEMVPRAIATVLSYEAERKTVGELVKRIPKKQRKNIHRYFANRRYPNPRLRFNMKEGTPSNMNHLTLLYPSVTLAKLFDPLKVLNKKKTIDEIKNEIKYELQMKLEQISYEKAEDDGRSDERWYYIAPLLMDSNEESIQEWFEQDSLLSLLEDDDYESKDRDKAALEQHFEKLRETIDSEDPPVLGNMPRDLLEVLTEMALASPAVCVLRMLNEPSSEIFPYIIKLAKTIVDRFNTPESTAIVDLQYGKEGNSHWKNALKYGVDGNIQAMLDEYSHMLLEEGGLNQMDHQDRNRYLLKTMSEALTTHTASYNVDTFKSFKKRVSAKSKKVARAVSSMKLRTNFAVGFTDTRNEDNTLNRKENIRLAFNSPFRPFVLATTSIGQEGLDFHYYCHKIMHWNLPSNPIDLEQRDGRIDRYKNHAIRQNIAAKYRDIDFTKDIWTEMFSAANQWERDAETSELVPFWSLPGNNEVAIQRIFPLYPLSRDGAKYNRLMKILALYRLSLGQTRQEDLLEHLINSDVSEDQLQDLFMNLSPFLKETLYLEK